MPFTATHVAAVVPVAWLCRWRLPLSALAIGSMVPDIAGFYPGVFDYPSTHSFPGVLTHCVPLGLILFYLFHILLKRPLVDLLPPPLSRRLAQWSCSETELRHTRVMVVIGCVAIGAVTHVVWDAFTHEWGWGVEMFPSLQQIVFHYGDRPIPAFSVIQHGSSLLLLPPLTLGFLWWAMQQPANWPMKRRFTMPRSISWTAGAMLAVGGWIYLQALYTNHVETTWIGALRTSVKHCGAVAMIVFLAYCLGMHLVWWLQSRHDEPTQPETDMQTSIDSRQCTGQAAHEVLRARPLHGSSQQVMIADVAHAPLDSAPRTSSEAWS